MEIWIQLSYIPKVYFMKWQKQNLLFLDHDRVASNNDKCKKELLIGTNYYY